MIYIDDGKTKEQLKAERAAAEAERRRPIPWSEYQERIRKDPPMLCTGLVDRLQLETVPEDLRPLFEAQRSIKR